MVVNQHSMVLMLAQQIISPDQTEYKKIHVDYKDLKNKQKKKLYIIN